jgi:hypothetical protein
MRSATLLPVSFLILFPALLGAQANVPTWRVEPVARAGEGDGPGGLTTVSGVTVSRDGTLYVAQPQEHVVKVYDSAGRYLRSIGREGAGPGEFERPSTLGWRGDTLWVADAPQIRIGLFRPDGTFLRSIRFSQASPLTNGRPQIPGSLLADGSVVGFWQAPLGVLAAGPVQAPVVRFSPHGEPLEVIAQRERRNEYGQLRGDRGTSYFAQPFTDSPLMAVAPDGSGIIIVRREAAAGAEPATFSVRRITPSGTVTFSRNYLYRPLPLSADAVERAVQEHMARMSNAGIPRPEAAALRRALRENLYRPRFLPPVTAVVVGRDGTIWLRREELGRPMAWWHVLDARGRLIARAWVPARISVRYADRTQLWAVELDELDVPTLVRFRVVPSR